MASTITQSGITNDSATTPHNGTLFGIVCPSLVASPWANYNGAMSFDGVNRGSFTAGIDCGTSSALTVSGVGSAAAFCIEAKIQTGSSLPSNGHIAGRISSASNAGGMQPNIYVGSGNKIQCDVRNNSGTSVALPGVTVLTTNTKYDVASTYDGTTWRLFLNGALEASATLAGVEAPDTTTRFLIGRTDATDQAFSSGGNPFTGTIAEVRMSNIPRYTAAYTPATSPFTNDGNTLGLWHLDSIPTGWWQETITATATWTAPSKASNGYDVTSIRDITCWGSGGPGGAGSSLFLGGGGGGGAYSKKTGALAVTPGTNYFANVAIGQDTWFNTTNAAPSSTTTGCMAKSGTTGGAASATAAGTAGSAGTAASSVGDIKHSGGGGFAGGGGGGGAGSNGDGSTGGVGSTTQQQGGGAGGLPENFFGGQCGSAAAPGNQGAFASVPQPASNGGGGGGEGTSTAGGAGNIGVIILTYNRQYAKTPTETLTTTDTPTRQFTGFRTVNESVGAATDTISRGASIHRTATESLTTSDTVTRGSVIVRTVTETTPTHPATDTPSRTFVGARIVTESVGPAADTPSRVFTATRTATETKSTTDTPSRIVAFNRNPSESVGPAADTLSRVLVLHRTATETLTTTDTPTRTAHFNRTVSEYPFGATPDWPIVNATKSISGVVYNHETGLVVNGATVWLFRYEGGAGLPAVHVQTTTSAADGSFTFPRDQYDPYTYFYKASYSIGGVQYHGVSDVGLVPS